MKRTRLTTGLTAGALLALAPAGLAQFSAADFLETAGGMEAPAAEETALEATTLATTGATFAADAALESCPEAAAQPAEGRAMIGVLLAEGEGAPTVQAVIAGGPAEAAGLRPGDVLVSVGDRLTGSLKTLRQALEGRAVGDAVQVGVDRGGESLLLTLELADSEALDLPEGPQDLEEPILDEWIEEEVVEEEIELELAELEELVLLDPPTIDIEDVVLEDVTNGESGIAVHGAHGIVVLEDVTFDVEHEVEHGQPQVLHLRTKGSGGHEQVEVIELDGDANVFFGDAHGEGGGHGVRLLRNVAVPVPPKAPGACCDCDCSCTAAPKAPQAPKALTAPGHVQVWTTKGPNGTVQRHASKQVDVAGEITRALRESGVDDLHISEVLRALEAHQLDGELSFGLSVGGTGGPETRIVRERVHLEGPMAGHGGPHGAPHGPHAPHGHEAPHGPHGPHGTHEHGADGHGSRADEPVDVRFGWTAEAPHPPHGGEHAPPQRVQLRWTAKGTNAAEAPSSGYFFEGEAPQIEVDVQRLHEAHESTEAHPLVQGYRIRKPKRPSADAAEQELELLRDELRALRREIRDLRSAIRARGR